MSGQPMRKTTGSDFATLRASLDGQTGPRFWRSLEELATTEEFTHYLHREFPEAASEWTDPASRRNFLRLMGASLALAGVGVSGCDYHSAPPDKIVPYVRQPERIVPGQSLRYATAVSLGGVGTGVVAESHEGRPTMLEGNPNHPDSLGAIDPLTQASLLGLYDPDRSQVVMKGRMISTFDSFLAAAVSMLDAQRTKKGAGLRLLTTTVTSPSLARQIKALRKEFPEATWHQYEPAAPHAAKAGLKRAFGKDVSTHFYVERADVIVALDCDFLAAGGNRLADARGFGDRRDPGPDKTGMNRLYAVEPSLTVTGASADHRLPLKSADVLAFALELAKRLNVPGVAAPSASPAVATLSKFLDALAKDLKAHAGKSLVLVGPNQPEYVHAVAAIINHALGNDGEKGTIVYTDPVESEPVDQLESLAALCQAMTGGKVEALLILGGNPAYNAPVNLDFTAAMTKVPFKARLGLHEDESSALCDWHIPEAHELETWGDVLAADGTATIQQPLIAPLYDGISAIELIASVLRHPGRTGLEIVRETWKGRVGATVHDFETYWRTSIHDGVVAETRLPAQKVSPKGDLGPAPASLAAGEGFELIFRPDPTIWDGRFTNNGWLQELPKPISKLVWENAAYVSLATAEKLGVADGGMVSVTYKGRTIEAPALISPGHADNTVVLHFGYGRTRTGRVGTGTGFNAFALWTTEAPGFPGFGVGAEVKSLGRAVKLATTQSHRNVDWQIQGEAAAERGLVRVATLDEYRASPDFAHHGEHGHEPAKDDTLYNDDRTPTHPFEPDYQWGMVVDLSRCTGCEACVLSCQAENNIPVVGKSQVLNQREMHWMEIDRYYEGDPANPSVHHQPRLCMHCENAPCELVCPVAATVHDHEGLNVMVYNRCVGTRYCSNNCPYKVRHFNFLQYADLRTPSLALINNPDVTVRARGVMEKCSYCVQRISAARIAAEKEDRRLHDGEVITACQSACPTRAITFGDISLETSAVAKLKKDARNYGMLAELNTRPRTSYLAKVWNPNPEIATEPTHHGV
jgi:MoCo/4Fe-4S cofactor protein with predicted Tat translocation signal